MQEDEIIEIEEQMIGVQTPINKLGKSLLIAFPAFEERNFRIYFFAQIVSLAGTWMQNVALGWLVFELTHSALMVGVVGMVGYIPVMLFSLFSGALADKHDKRMILYITQLCPMVLALMLGYFVATGQIAFWGLLLSSLILGVINSFDIPVRISFVSSLVSHENLPSAAILNMSITNSARIIGPALAGIMIALVGAGGTFFLNAASFLVVILALTLIKLPKHELTHSGSNWEMVKEGIDFVYHKQGMLLLIFVGFPAAIFGFSLISLAPAISGIMYQGRPEALGYMLSAIGVGAVISTAVLPIFLKKNSSRVLVIVGTFLLATSLGLFSMVHNMFWSLLSLMLSGLSFNMVVGSSNVVVQQLTGPKLRGRVISIFMTIVMIGFIIGPVAVGHMIEIAGLSYAFRVNSLLVFACGLIFYLLKKKIPDQFNSKN